ncbi:MAG: hypothetical protein WC319_09245 [Candidatus Paceibacterota bacterium]|jgi:hypothetical protein
MDKLTLDEQMSFIKIAQKMGKSATIDLVNQIMFSDPFTDMANDETEKLKADGGQKTGIY